MPDSPDEPRPPPEPAGGIPSAREALEEAAPEEPPAPPPRPAPLRPRTAPPPEPPAPLPTKPAEAPGTRRRELEHRGQAWIATVAGEGAGGTGSWGLGYVDAVRFARADRPEKPLFEALLPRRRFDDLFEEELAALLDAAVPLEDERPEG